MKIKSEKGITLVSVIVYVLVMVILIGLVVTLTSYFKNNVSLMDTSTKNVAEYNKFNMYFTKDTKATGNYVVQVSSDKRQIAFANGNTYTFQDNGIYMNKIKICTNIAECQFNIATEQKKQIISVYIVSGESLEFSKTTEYIVNIETKVMVSSIDTIEINYSTITPTNGNVNVTLTNKSGNSDLILKYQIENTTDTWTTYTNPIVMTTNGTIYARLENSTGQNNGYVVANVTNIDKVPPTIETAIAGAELYTDPKFASGLNSTRVYNNSSNGTVTVTRVTNLSGTPTGNTTGLEIKTTGTASPGWGGFYFATQSAGSKVFITRIVAKIPVGYTIEWGSNATGDGRTLTWLSTKEGTGQWQEYMLMLTCGTTGTFSTTNFYYILGGNTPTTSSPLTWQVAYATVIDATTWGSTNNVAIKATDTGTNGCATNNIGIVGVGINQSSTTPPTFTTYARTLTLTTMLSNITTKGTYYVWAKDAAGNIAKFHLLVSPKPL